MTNVVVQPLVIQMPRVKILLGLIHVPVKLVLQELAKLIAQVSDISLTGLYCFLVVELYIRKFLFTCISPLCYGNF